MKALIQNDDQSLRVIIPSVLFLHACALVLLFTFSAEHQAPPIPKKLLVSSIQLKPKTPSIPKRTPIAEAPAPPIPKKELAKEEEPQKVSAKEETKPAKKEAASTPTPKVEKKTAEVKAPAKKPVAKKDVPQKKPVAAKPAPSPKPVAAKPEPTPKTTLLQEKQLALLSKAKEKIGKIDTASDKVIATSNLSKNTPQKITGLSIDSLNVEAAPSMGLEELAYRDELALRLKLLLKLPEYGEVKLKLKIDRSGKVMEVNIVNSSSEKNSAMIKKALPQLTMPSFGTQFKGSPHYTFTITLSNE